MKTLASFTFANAAEFAQAFNSCVTFANVHAQGMPADQIGLVTLESNEKEPVVRLTMDNGVYCIGVRS